MTAQLCIAPHRDNPPTAASGLKLCFGHHATVVEALTGPSAAQDQTVECAWGYTDGQHIVLCADAHRAFVERAAAIAIYMERIHRTTLRLGQSITAVLGPPPGPVMCGDDDGWYLPHEYRPGGLTRDWLALQQRGSTQATGEQAPYVSHGTDNPLPIDGRVAQLRHDVPAVLRSWTGLHVQTFGVTAPASPSVGQLVTWLAIYRDHAAAQDWAGDYVRELGELRARARRLIDLPGPARAAVGPCPERIEGQQCGGTLYSDIREERDPRPSEVRCDACGTGWDSTQWMRLGQRVAMQARRMAA